jgi:hypothetical protein
MANRKSDLIIELDMIHDNLHCAKQNTNNPLIIYRIEQIKKSVLSLMNEVEKINSINVQKVLKPRSTSLNPPQKKKKAYQAPKGKNAHRQSTLFNPQGGFKPTASYHVKGYED